VLKDNTLASSTVAAFADSMLSTPSNTTLALPVMKMGDDALTVSYDVIRGSANADDVTIRQGELTWAQGDTTAQEISLTIEPNSADESDEMFFVRLYNPQGGGIAPGLGYARITIEGVVQSGVAELNIDALTALETDTNVTVNVTRQGGAEGELNISYTVEGDTATAGADFQAQSGTLSWADGETQSQSITVSLINDSNEEAEEQFSAPCC
jgi:hypothetical protein